MNARLAYIMSRFPHLPETFILREMGELERQGWDIELFPLIFQEQTVIHAEARAWIPRSRHLPHLSKTMAMDNAREIARSPQQYLALWGRITAENYCDIKLLPRALLLFPKAFSYARYMQRQGVQHIHAHFATYPAMVAWLIHKITGIGYSFTIHAHDIYVHKAMLSTKVRDAVFVAAISAYNREYLVQHVGEWAREKTHIIHCGIEPDRYVPRSLDDIQSRQGLFKIANIGSLQLYKGQSYLIEACALLKQRGINFQCSIIGEGEERQSLAEQIRNNGLENIVIFEGPKKQDEVALLLPQYDCYVQPSIITNSGKMEGIPVALMEAMASRIPCVASDISGIPELVRHEETGLLIPPANPVVLADTIERIYRKPDEASRIAQAGYELVMKDFVLQDNVRSLSHLFEGSIRRVAQDG